MGKILLPIIASIEKNSNALGLSYPQVRKRVIKLDVIPIDT